MGMKTYYEIMHGDRKVAWVDAQGHCKIYYRSFLPYNLYLDDSDDMDLDVLVDNVTNFWYWCATRVLTLDRQYAKEILNSIGAVQAVTDRERAQIALSYRCVSLTDIFWVKLRGEKVSFAEVNLYDNHLGNAFVEVALRGRQLTVSNRELAQDLSTNGCFPKAWVRTGQGFQLLKDGGREAVENEVLASRICQCFRCAQVCYQPGTYDGEIVSVSGIMTTKEYSIASREAFEIYAANKGIDPMLYVMKLDGYSYYMMNILDYLVGNTDRHWGNWGFLVDNKKNKPVSLHPLMDFNQAFHSYDTIEGANCQTVLPEKLTQREAALAAVKKVGLNQRKEIEKSWFGEQQEKYGMFAKRLAVLREAEKKRNSKRHS